MFQHWSINKPGASKIQSNAQSNTTTAQLSFLLMIQSNTANSIQMFQSTPQHNLKNTVELNLSEEPRIKKTPNSWSNAKEAFAWSKLSQNQPNLKQTAWIVPEPWKSMKTLILDLLSKKSLFDRFLGQSWKIRENPEVVISCEKWRANFGVQQYVLHY